MAKYEIYLKRARQKKREYIIPLCEIVLQEEELLQVNIEISSEPDDDSRQAKGDYFFDDDELEDDVSWP